MNPFVVPPCRADLAAWPPPILTSEIGTFAHHTLRDRLPAILRETRALNEFPPDIRAELDRLHAELTGGVIRDLQESTPDAAFWRAVSAPQIGHSWLDVPWYWAEAYFYRRILEATRYFQPGPWQGVDPFAAKKRQEWAPDAAPRTALQLVQSLPEDPAARFNRLLHASLWGNRTDLSYTVAAHLGATAQPADERENLLADDSAALWRFLQTRAGGSVALLADNAGTELLIDLLLIDFLLCSGLADQVHLHLKPQPLFVSDAMLPDLVAGLDALAALGGDGQKLAYRLDGHVAAGDLVLKSHWFNTTSLFYCQMPEDLVVDLAGMRLVLVKGDANYRRLLGDAHWAPTTPFAEVLSYFPAPVAALRTLKAEIIVGLAPGQAERLAAEDPAWLVNGRRGVIQARFE